MHNEEERGILAPKTCLIMWWCTNACSDIQDRQKGCSVIKVQIMLLVLSFGKWRS